MKQQTLSFSTAIRQSLRWLESIYPGRSLGLVAAPIFLLVGWLGRPATSILLVIGLGLLVYYAIWLYNALHYWNGTAWVDAATTCAPPSAYQRAPEINRFSVAVCHLTQFGVFGVPQRKLRLPLVRR